MTTFEYANRARDYNFLQSVHRIYWKELNNLNVHNSCKLISLHYAIFILFFLLWRINKNWLFLAPFFAFEMKIENLLEFFYHYRLWYLQIDSITISINLIILIHSITKARRREFLKDRVISNFLTIFTLQIGKLDKF